MSTQEHWADFAKSRVGQAIAVLGTASTLSLVAELLEADEPAVRAVIRQLPETTGARFEHPEVGERILRTTPEEIRQKLHGRAAELLYHRGFPACTVADHLVDAGAAGYPWAVEVLLGAAEDATINDQINLAVDRLELAYRATRDAGERAAIAIQLVCLEWRINPSTRSRQFTRLRAALRAGRVPHSELPAAIMYLLWHGQVPQADHALAQLNSGNPDEATPEIDFLRAWLRYSYPPHVQRHPRLFAAPARPPRVRIDQHSPHRHGADLLSGLFTHPLDEIATLAQRLLTSHRLTSTTIETLVAAVQCLIYSNRLDTAAAWCESLLAEADARRAPTWQSVFAGLRAETMLRKGAMRDATTDAALALNYVPAEHLGVWVGAPIAAMVRALTVTGRHAEAAAQLKRPVPRTIFESRFGLPYLHAQGHHQLAVGHADEALRTFRRCGYLMRRWNMDFPWLVPWRNDIAAAHLALGEHRQAREFATRHLDLLGAPDRHRSGGVSLRLLAATSDRYQGFRLLRESAAIARTGGDDAELATVLGELGKAHRAVGDLDRSRALIRDAIRLAESCGAQVLLSELLDGKPQSATQPTQPMPALRPIPGGLATLSPAERRVAELAARGKANREIADKLAITTSTVEQHLTRVYRKLGVARRSELYFVLPTSRTGAPDTAVSATG
ncbi:LuxR C-terminal-related transcriptional regulator [Nocardia sp. NBC_00565]|uniref:LuxR C-terminal-related transcriptional regulator n=1 Tax=Nocardia sp. NBC_00565 TaxID=2975993 RepID=UPI002E80C955|nr:LuxR C-terminal-related transcriptional regulator [Nocardia sp. NBC_00565]WUC00302.1 LuxR C-terminal-related transcriptional regulator [Nocardia sp. NBC_00565]